MVKLALYFKAELENVTDVGPSNEAYEWHFKVKCNNCNEINENWVGVNQLASNDITGSRGSANFVMRCKFCKREASAQFDNTSIKPYTIENSGQFSQIAIIECRGLEFVDFDPRVIVFKQLRVYDYYLHYISIFYFLRLALKLEVLKVKRFLMILI
ncbi:DUF866-domain-containing protein [Gigaspora margarita]|uniref:DUF866-domain-containing protein n=1 Tax=Gigaspora margarita TaxID=4874 RepID=A0A8H4AFD5_GIGMA|nr:DUF866-domain-containing protein [Gigaspora margarita]